MINRFLLLSCKLHKILLIIFKKANKAMQNDIKLVIDFLEERFLVISFTNIKVLANIQL